MPDEPPSTTEGGSSPDDDPGRGVDTPLEVSEINRLLSAPRRRLILSFLSTHDDAVGRDRLVDLIAERERPDPGPEPHRRRIDVALHHVHLPQLADAGLIAYDPVAETVRYSGSDVVETLLEAMADADRVAEERG